MGMTMIEKIADLIRARGFTQDEVERRCGLAKNRITKWKEGTGEPTARQALLLADLFGVPFRFLVDDGMAEPDHGFTEAQRQLMFVAEPIGYERAAKIILRSLAENVPPTAASRPARQGIELDPRTGRELVPREPSRKRKSS